MTLKNKIKTLKNLIGMRQMTLSDPKFDIKKSLETLFLWDESIQSNRFQIYYPDFCALYLDQFLKFMG